MSKPRIILYKSKTLADGQSHPVMLMFHIQNKYLYSLGYSARDEEWNFKAGRYKKNVTNFEEKNNVLWQKEMLAEKVIQELALKESAFSFEAFKELFSGIKKTLTVYEFNKQRIDELRIEGAIGNMQSYTQLKQMLWHYKPTVNTLFTDIDYNFLKGFETYVLSRGTKKSTVFYYMRTLRALYNEAIRRGYVEEKNYPFKTQFKKNGYSISHLKGDYNPRPLSVKEFERLLQFPILQYKQFEQSYAFFMFLIEARGLNFVDLCQLQNENFVNGRLQYVRRKTGKLYNLPITNNMMQIIEKYRGKDYIYPKMDKAPTNLVSRENFIRGALSDFNDDMKTIGDLLGFDVKLTSYVCRYTYTNLLIQKHIAVPFIQQALGHSNISTTQHYIKKFSNEEVDKAVALF